jgi:alpha-1,6-mannosyltransferase
MLKQWPVDALFFITSALLVVIIGYTIERHETWQLLAAYSGLFLIFAIIIRQREALPERRLTFWVAASVIFRALLLFAVPALSDDFYRFIWDGRLLAGGYHPFSEVPTYYMEHRVNIPGIDEELFDHLNAKATFTSYPSVAQLIFWVSVKLSPDSVYGSVLVMKFTLFFFELGTLQLLRCLLQTFNIHRANILLYSLNPLVILEITGNLHFEGVMIFFLLLAIHLLMKQRFLASSFAYALSICAKLIPIIFLPLLVRYFGWKKAIIYALLTAALVVLLFLPLLDMDIIKGFSTSLGYYFLRFEFNASVYYLIRAIGYLIFGFNIIQFAGPVLALAATVIIFRIALRRLPAEFPRKIDKSFFQAMLWCLFVYFLSTSILHPWYIITLLTVSLFTTYRFPLVWTGVIFLTYAGYTENGFNENLLLTALEYLVVIGYLVYETIWSSGKSHS